MVWGIIARATPFVVLRTAGGFLVGTNSTRSDGMQHCKIHYTEKKLLLVAGQPVEINIGQGDKARTVLDVHKELWKVFRHRRDDERLMHDIGDAIARDIGKAAPKYKFKDAHFYLALLSTDGEEPKLWTEIVDFTAADMRHPAVRVVEQKIPVGTTMVWANTDEPQFFSAPMNVKGTGVVDSKDVLKILEALAEATRRDYAAIHLVDHGYEPPFILLSLDSKGMTDVQGDLSPCTNEHPLPESKSSANR
jgi:hypothetical protein